MKKRTTVYAILGIGTVVIIVLVLYFAGFRITYDPTILNDWGAISACASWANVIGSVFAIFVAIQIPSRIAEKQNKIALFEKRFAFYEVLNNCVSFANLIENSQVQDYIDGYFVASFSTTSLETEPNQTREWLKFSILESTVSILRQGEFLFDFQTDELITLLTSRLVAIISMDKSHSQFSDFC